MGVDDMPEEDSGDLTNEEILAAVLTSHRQQIVEYLHRQTCGECRGRVIVTGHALRRRTPHLYWRVLGRCSTGHEARVTFQADWLLRR
jgi:hypothetical protein